MPELDRNAHFHHDNFSKAQLSEPRDSTPETKYRELLKIGAKFQLLTSIHDPAFRESLEVSTNQLSLGLEERAAVEHLMNETGCTIICKIGETVAGVARAHPLATPSAYSGADQFLKLGHQILCNESSVLFISDLAVRAPFKNLNIESALFNALSCWGNAHNTSRCIAKIHRNDSESKLFYENNNLKPFPTTSESQELSFTFAAGNIAFGKDLPVLEPLFEAGIQPEFRACCS